MTLGRALARCLIPRGGSCSPRSLHPRRAPERLASRSRDFAYPYPVHFMPLTLQGEDLRLAYMDVAPVGASNGRTVVLLHGRNFPSSYWEPTIKALTEAGYRVIAPDQIGFGKSSNPLSPTTSTRWRAPRSRCSIAFTSTASIWSAIRWAGCSRSGWRAPMDRASITLSSIRRSAWRTIDSMFRR